MKINFRKPSILRNLLISFVVTGLLMGSAFSVLAWVLFEPGRVDVIKMTVAAVSTGIVSGFLFFSLLNQILLKKIARIAEVAHAVSENDITHNCVMQSHDMIGEIISSVNHMTENLRDIFGVLNSSAGQLVNLSQRMNAITEETGRGSRTQQDGINQVATAVTELNATAQEVARNAEQAAAATHEADEQGNNAKLVTVEAMGAIDNLAESVNRATGVIRNLEAESENIGKVLEVINGIAEQTNLLALNAAIEAARAGEQGRGFAVVADEVRTLATRTQSSTEEINAMIERLQAGTRQAVAAMEEGSKLANEGVERTESTAESLAEISGAVSTINSMVTQIATAASEQSSVVEDINRNVEGISQAAEMTTEGTHQTRATSQELNELATTMQNILSRFRI